MCEVTQVPKHHPMRAVRSKAKNMNRTARFWFLTEAQGPVSLPQHSQCLRVPYSPVLLLRQLDKKQTTSPDLVPRLRMGWALFPYIFKWQGIFDTSLVGRQIATMHIKYFSGYIVIFSQYVHTGWMQDKLLHWLKWKIYQILTNFLKFKLTASR